MGAPTSIRMPACTPALLAALNDSIFSGRFADTKIILFSRRDTSGVIRKPRALYASSHVLRTVPYFNDLLFGQFGEAESKDFSEPLDDSECADDYGYYSDSDLEEDEISVSPKDAPEQTGLARGDLSDIFYFLPVEDEPACGEYEECLEKGKVIKIQDMAFITFQAFLLYLYTDSIEFAPYGWDDNRGSRSAEVLSVSEDSIPRPSPKSIYRLADKYDVPVLKQLALEGIEDGLGHCDIVGQIFSKFTSKYEEVRTMQIDHLAAVRFGGDEKVTKYLCDKIDEKVDAYAKGGLEHAAEAIALLWEASKENKCSSPVPQSTSGCVFGYSFGAPASPSLFANSQTPQNTSIPAPPGNSPANWECMESALIRSIREGVFADRKYWTRYSKAGKVLRPVHFSSIVAGERLPYIDILVKQYNSSHDFFGKDDIFEDSDYEGEADPSGNSAAEEGASSSDGQSDKGTLQILTMGSFASWRSLFFYMCGQSINFAPLKSQGLDTRAQCIQEEADKDLHVPPPCSPKAIHSLAVALDIKPLRDLALKEIQSSITSANIVNEFFASPTSRQIGVMKMQYELLSEKFGDLETNASVATLIRSMADGTRTHHASALKFGLREGFSRKRRAPAEPAPVRPASPPIEEPQFSFKKKKIFRQ